MGKTALVTNITEHIARAGGHVAFFSLEMSAEQLTYRLIAQMSGVSYSDVEEGNRMMPGGQRFSDVMTAAGEIAEMPIHIDESMGTAEQMFSKVRRLIATSQIDVVMVDYIQLMSSSRDHGNRTQDVSAISQGLKALAKQLKIPVIALSQLNRGVEGRQDYHPKLSDLRDSGKIEEDAAVVMSIYRPDYYFDDDDMEDDEASSVDVDVLKNRFGPTGRAKLGWDGTCGRFTNDIKVIDL
jgi:replicative DNA helicase